MDALKQAQKVSALVSQGKKRKYYRFRWAPFYGGIATADCVGCCLKCVFCWSWKVMTHPEHSGKFYNPEHVANQLIKIARKKKCALMRISGNEPTLHPEHLLGVLSAIPSEFQFILETNGILLGHDQNYCRDLARFPNLHIRVSIKGCTPQDFQRLTGMDVNGFDLQIKALENLLVHGVHCSPAVMGCFSNPQARDQLNRLLKSIHPQFRFFEEEELILYPAVEERLRKWNLLPLVCYTRI